MTPGLSLVMTGEKNREGGILCFMKRVLIAKEHSLKTIRANGLVLAEATRSAIVAP